MPRSARAPGWLVLGAALAACRSHRSAPGAPAGSAAPGPPARAAAGRLAPAPADDGPLYDRVLILGDRPAIPTALGPIEPGASKDDALAARPPAWGDAWAHRLLDAPPTTVRVELGPGGDVRDLAVATRAPHLRERLTRAWGPPALRATHTDTVGDIACWRDPAARLEVCHENADYVAGGGDLLTFFHYQPIADTFAAGAPLAPEHLASYLGRTRAQLAGVLPSAAGAATTPADGPALTFSIPTSGYRATPDPDRGEVDFDARGRADRIVVDFVVDDQDRYAAAADEVRAAAARAQGRGRDVIIGGSRPHDVSLVVARPGP